MQVCTHTLQLDPILILLLWYFQSNLGIFLKAVLDIQRFRDLLCFLKKKGSPAAGPLRGGSWRRWFRSGAGAHQEDRQKGKTDAWPAYFDLTRAFSWEEEAASCTAPSCGQEVCRQPGPHSQAEEQKNQNVRAEKYLRKKWSPPTRMKLRSRGHELCWQMKVYLTSARSRACFLLKPRFLTILVCENHLGRFFFKQLYWCLIDVQ